MWTDRSNRLRQDQCLTIGIHPSQRERARQASATDAFRQKQASYATRGKHRDTARLNRIAALLQSGPAPVQFTLTENVLPGPGDKLQSRGASTTYLLLEHQLVRLLARSKHYVLHGSETVIIKPFPMQRLHDIKLLSTSTLRSED